MSDEEILAKCKEAAQRALVACVGSEQAKYYRIEVDLCDTVHHIDGSVEFESKADRQNAAAMRLFELHARHSRRDRRSDD